MERTSMRSILATVAGALAITLSACNSSTSTPSANQSGVPAPVPTAFTPGDSPAAAKSTRSLASFAKSGTAACYDRAKEPYTAVVDTHFHPKPFGGQATSPEELFGILDKAGVRFVNYFG